MATSGLHCPRAFAAHTPATPEPPVTHAFIALGLIALAAIALTVGKRQGAGGGRPNGREKARAAPEADSTTLTCTCAEWRGVRARFATGDPRRLCGHLCAALTAPGRELPPDLLPFAPLVRHMGARGLGVPCTRPSLAFVLEGVGYVALLPPEDTGCITLFRADKGYRLSLADNQWQGEAPPHAQELGSLLRGERQRRRGRARHVGEHTNA